MTQASIMIVEDERIVAEDIRITLEEKGYSVCGIASAGDEALRKIDPQHRPDLVLMDIKLKGQMDGIETAARIRELHDIPVIFLTAFSDDELLKRARITAPFGYIIKPFIHRELFSCIEMALYKKELDDRLKHSEALYRAVVEDQTEAICRFLEDGTIVFANAVYRRHFQLDSTDPPQDNYFHNLQEAERDQVRQALGELGPDRPTIRFESCARGDNGRPHCFEWTLRELFRQHSPSGRVEYQAVGRDISERKEAERALQESLETSRALLNAPSDPFVLIEAGSGEILGSQRGRALPVRQGRGPGPGCGGLRPAPRRIRPDVARAPYRYRAPADPGRV